PPPAPLLPYTTLFRSRCVVRCPGWSRSRRGFMKRGRKTDERTTFKNSGRFLCRARGPRPVSPERLRPTKDRGHGGRAENHPEFRSEEHTSELQSLRHL